MNPIAFYKTLADTTRLKIVLLLAHASELCVCDLIQALQESQPKVSRHLALMKQAGLLRYRKQGLWVFYRLNPELPAWVCSVFRLSQPKAPGAPLDATALRSLRRDMQIIFQDPYASLNPRLTVGAIVGEVSAPEHDLARNLWQPIGCEGLTAQMMHGNGAGFLPAPLSLACFCGAGEHS